MPDARSTIAGVALLRLLGLGTDGARSRVARGAWVSLVLACAFPSRGLADEACKVQELAIEAALGDRRAQYNLAVEFWRGELVAQDLAKAANLWAKAADQGDIDAASNLGYLLFHGRGVEAEPSKAMALWHGAADAGHPEAHLHLSRALASGQHVPPDPGEAYARAMAARLIAERSRDEVDQAIAQDAERQLEALSARLSEAERARATKVGRGYAGAR